MHWSATNGVRWRLPLPGPGNSTPIVWGDRVFLTQAVPSSGERLVLCFDRIKGTLLWKQGTNSTGNELTHDTNPYCSGSPVTDGERVVAWFGSGGVFCFDLEGRELWRRELGPQRHIWGHGTSPVLHGDLCFLNFGPGEPSFLVALDKKTGEEVWRRPEPEANSGEKKAEGGDPKWVGSWSMPLLVHTGSRDELLMSWPLRLVSLDPSTGTQLWSCGGLNPLVYTTPLYHREKNIAVAMGGYRGMAIAVKAGGSGDVTETHRLWHHARTEQRIGSGVLHGEHFYIHNDPGLAECWELESGKLVWKERLRGPAPKSESWSSMVLADERIWVINQGGDAFVLRASPRFEVLATNSIGETTMASLAPSRAEIFIRTHEHLWCIDGTTK